MTRWEYRKIDLSEQRPRSDELDILNAAGADGWELVGISRNNFAYVKRQLEEGVAAQISLGTSETRFTEDAKANGIDERDGKSQEVKAKYRDPVTNETWSGRGRMANWLKRKQDAGEDIDDYLV